MTNTGNCTTCANARDTSPSKFQYVSKFNKCSVNSSKFQNINNGKSSQRALIPLRFKDTGHWKKTSGTNKTSE